MWKYPYVHLWLHLVENSQNVYLTQHFLEKKRKHVFCVEKFFVKSSGIGDS
jgi:hypothetical protein